MNPRVGKQLGDRQIRDGATPMLGRGHSKSHLLRRISRPGLSGLGSTIWPHTRLKWNIYASHGCQLPVGDRVPPCNSVPQFPVQCLGSVEYLGASGIDSTNVQSTRFQLRVGKDRADFNRNEWSLHGAYITVPLSVWRPPLSTYSPPFSPQVGLGHNKLLPFATSPDNSQQ